MKNFSFAFLALLCLLPACKKKEERYNLAAGIITPYEHADAIIGKWTGPEGTSLTIAPKGYDTYVITIVNLDGPRNFLGRVTNNGLQFTRDGKTELIMMGDGQDTGMKYLKDKVDCLVVTKPGEGYCRD